jgi:ring-1,2-phenylacetyl-CoA epoxidase subunit PaaE
MKAKFHSLVVKDVQKETSDCCSILFDVPQSLQSDYQFIQGQYLTLKTQIDQQEVRRSYSICSSPLDGELRVAVKHIKNGLFSTFANQELVAGDTLDVMTPTGNFYTELATENTKNYIAFAAGSGITPILSILKTVLLTEPKSTFTLFYGNKNTASIIFREAIEALKNKFMLRLKVYYFMTRESLESPLMNGRIDADKCEQIFDKLVNIESIDDCFSCGPESMIFAVRDTLLNRGFEGKKIHFELFTSPLAKLGTEKKRLIKEEDKDKICKVTIKLDGLAFDFDLPFDTDNILDAALKHGADLPYACKGGVCCTCKAKLQKGEVDMHLNYALEPDQVDAGFILTCQAFPTTEEVLVDFDEL